jgi:hypothetical protein
MPPTRTIIVDRYKLLESIQRLAAEQHADALDRTVHYREQERDDALMRAQWVPRDLGRLAGRPLTPSERKRHQQAIVAMEAEGLVSLGVRLVKLLPAGAEFLAERHSAG